MPVWIPGVDKTQDCLPENKFLNVEKRVVYKQNVRFKFFCSRDVEAILIKGYFAQTILSLSSSPKGNDRSPESNVPTSSHFKQASK